MKRNIKLLLSLFLVLLIPSVYGEECKETEDINEMLKYRWPWNSNANHKCKTCYYNVHSYYYSTQLILDYKDNSKYLIRSSEKKSTSKFKEGTWLKINKETWKEDVEIWLPEPTSETGKLLYLYYPGKPNTKKILNQIKWAPYKVKCKQKETRDNLEYVVTSDDESLWKIWLSVREDSRKKGEAGISWKRFLEINGNIKGVKEYLELIEGPERNSEKAKKFVIIIKKGDKIKTGEKKYVEEAQEQITDIDLKVKKQVEGLANSENVHLLDVHDLFDNSLEQEINTGLKKLLTEKKVLIKIYTISPIQMGSYTVPAIADSIADQIKDNFFEKNPKYENHKVIILVLMRPDMQYHEEKEKDIRYTISLNTLNIQGMSGDIVYSSLFDAAGIERSTGRIFGSINEIIKSKDKLMKFFELLIDKGTATKEKILTKKRIIIDPGHGRECFYSSDKILAKFETRGRPDQETRLNTRFATELKEIMQREFGDSVEVILTREEDNFNPGSSLGLGYTKDYRSENHCSIDDGNSCEQPCNYNKKDEKDRVYCVVDPFYQYELDTRNRVHVSCIKCIKDNCMNLYNKCPDKEKEFDDCIKASCNDYCISRRESLKITDNDQSIFGLGKKDMEKADLFISIHHDACGKGSYRCYGPYVINAKEHNKLGEELCFGLTNVYNRYKSKSDNEILPKDCYLKEDFILLNEGGSVDIPSVIIEVGFMNTKSSREIELIGLHKAITAETTPDEVDLLPDSQEPSKSFRNEMQKSIIEAVKTYLQIQIKEPTKVSEIDVSDYKKIAIILDDGGHSEQDDDIIKELSARQNQIPLTLAVMPGCPDTSKVVGEIAKYKNSEVILHQPMEAEKKLIPECKPDTHPKRAIYNSDSNEEAKTKLGANINEIKGYLGEKVDKFVGLNNHMGSLVTQNLGLMSAVALYLKNSNLLFVDSRTTSASVAYKIMKENGIKTFKRDLFLDTEGRDTTKELEKLEQQSIDKGYAIGIGHFKTETVDELFKYINEHYTLAEDASLGHKTYANHDKKIKLVLLSDLPYEKQDKKTLPETKIVMKKSAEDRIKEVQQGRLPDDSLYQRKKDDPACANGAMIMLDYIFGLGTSCDLDIFAHGAEDSKDAWEYRETILSSGGSVIKEEDIDYDTLPIGSILGVYYEDSSFKDRAKEKGSGYTHLGFYIGNRMVVHKFPNFKKDPVEALNQGKFRIIEAMIPPQNILDKQRDYKTYGFIIDKSIKEFLKDFNIPEDLQELYVAEIVRINDLKDGYNIPFEHSNKKIKIPILNLCGYNIEVPENLIDQGTYYVETPFLKSNGIKWKRVLEEHEFSIEFGQKLESALSDLKENHKGIYDKLEITSASRTFEKQTELRDESVRKKEDPIRAALPGTSEHEYGNAIDINTNSLTKDDLEVITRIFNEQGIVKTQPDERWHYALKPNSKEDYIAMLSKQKRRLSQHQIKVVAEKLFGTEGGIEYATLQGKELIKNTLDLSKSHMKESERDENSINEWAFAVYNGMVKAGMPITPETISLVLTIIEQESNFDPIPYVDLDKLCKNLPKRCASLGIKKLEICKTGNQQCDYFFQTHTGKIHGNLFASKMLAGKKGEISGVTTFEKQAWSIIGPLILKSIEINMGPMQVKSFRVKETLAKRQNKNYKEVEIDYKTFNKMFTIEGGVEFGIDYLNQVLSVLLRHSGGKITRENIRLILADYNGGAYSSRNAELQYELYKLIENKEPYPNFVDGDFLRWKAYLMPDSSQSLTESYVKRFVDKYPTYYAFFFKGSDFESINKFKKKYPQYHDVYLESLDLARSTVNKIPILNNLPNNIPFLNNFVFDPIRAQLILEKTTDFEETPIFKAIKQEYRKKFDSNPPFGIVPSAKTTSYKHGVEWGAQIYVDRAIKKFNSFCNIAQCEI